MATSAADERESELRLGWLEAFDAVARHRCYVGAATELGLDRTNVKRNVKLFERWLNRRLIGGGEPMEVTGPHGLNVLRITRRALRTLENFSDNDPAKRRLRSQLRLSDLGALSILNTGQSYKDLAAQLGCSVDQSRKKVKKLEAALGHRLVKGRSKICLSEKGEKLAQSVAPIALELKCCFAEHFDHEGLLVERLRFIWRMAIKRKAELSILVDRTQRKSRLSKLDRINRKGAEEALVHIDRIISEFREFAPHVPGRDIVICET